MRFAAHFFLLLFLRGALAQEDSIGKTDVENAKGRGHCKCPSSSCGIMGMPGSNGMPGMPGLPGHHGRDGSKGEKGEMGPQGLQGVAGAAGKMGPRGSKGEKGETGDKGENGIMGMRGEKGDAAKTDPLQRRNWKQCVWNSYSATDSGKIKECLFNKLHSNTALRVSYQGNLRVMGTRKCNRWFFKFNNSECSGPMTIEAAVYNDWYSLSGQPNLLYHRSFEGYCENLAQGTVRIELWVGKCSGYTIGDARTGWNSVSRIMVEEVPPSQ